MSVRRLFVAGVLLLVLPAFGGCGADSAAGSSGSSRSGVGTDGPTTKPEPTCPQTSRCYDFTEGAEGWPEVNDDNHFAGRDSYLDGSYRIGARQPGSWNMDAPVKASQLSDDYGVKVEADATMGQSFPDEAAWGATCWTRPVGDNAIAGFAVYVQPNSVTVGLYDENTGAFRPLADRQSDGLSKPGEKKHLILSCRQDSTSGTPQARIVAQLGGAPPVSVRYAKSVKNYGWQPADGIGLLAAGKGADVFYDHVVITPG